MRQNVAQSLPLPSGTNLCPSRSGAPIRTSSSTSTATGAGARTTTPFNTKLEHRGRSSLLTFAYTWAKSTDTKSAAAGIGATQFNGWQGFLDNRDPDRDHGLSDFDVDHRMVGSFVYNLPFGSGERFGGDATGVKNAIIGGWQVNGIATWQRGFPLTVSTSDLGGLNDTFGSNRADLVGDPDFRRRRHRPLVQHRRLRPAGVRRTRQLGPQHPSRPTPPNLDFSLFKNFGLGTRHQSPVPPRILQRAQPSAVQRRADMSIKSAFGVINSARAGRINQLGVEIRVLSGALERGISMARRLKRCLAELRAGRNAGSS